MRRLAPAITVLAVVLLAGCASNGAQSSFVLAENPLDSQIASHNRTGKVYNQFDTVFIVDVIYNSKPLRETWVERTALTRRLPEEGRKQLSDRELKEHGESAQFYIAFYTPLEKWDNLAAPDGSWSIFLENGAGPVRASSIDKVELEGLPWGAHLPFVPNFRTFYRVNFPRQKAGFGAQKLVVSSLLGEVKLTWKGQ